MADAVSGTQFTGLLKELGVDTLNLSFGWLLEDDDNTILPWFYKNIGADNALSESELRRYNDLLKAGKLDVENVDSELSQILLECDGLTGPTDSTGLKELEEEIQNMKERMQILSEQEERLDFLEKNNAEVKAQETQDTKHLRNQQLMMSVESSMALKDCSEAARSIEMKKNELVDIVHNTLEFYGNSAVDNTISNQLLACGPVEKYLQNRTLLMTYINVCTSQFKKEDNNISLNVALGSLYQKWRLGLSDLIESKGKFQSAMRTLQLNPESCNSSQISLDIARYKSTNSHLKADIKVLKERTLQNVIDRYVDEQCDLIWHAEGKQKLAGRKAVYSKLCEIMDNLQKMLNMDELLYFSMKRNCIMVEDAVQFAIDVKDHVEDEKNRVKVRADYMRSIQSELNAINQSPIDLRNPFIRMIKNMVKVKADEQVPVSELMKIVASQDEHIETLQRDIQEHYMNLIRQQTQMNSSTEYLHKFIWDGYSRQPNLFNITAMSLIESVKNDKTAVDKTIRDMVKKIAKQKSEMTQSSLLWIWFLTNEKKLLLVTDEAKRQCF